MAMNNFSFRSQDWNGEMDYNDLYAPPNSENSDTSSLVSSFSVSSFDSFMPSDSASLSGSSEDFQSSGFSFSNLPSAITGTMLTTANREITNVENSNRTIESNLGLTSEGHSFLAPIHAEIENTNNSNLTSIENSEIALGSAFGPEGLIAGVALAGLTSAIAPSFQQSENVVNTTSGQLV